MWIIIILVIIIALLVISTTKFKIHPFITLLLSAILMGFISGMDGSSVVKHLSEGFGNTLKSIGIIIAYGTIENKVILYNLAENKELRVLDGHQDVVINVVFNPINQLLATLSQDGEMKIWNLDKLLEEKAPGIFAKAKEAIKSGGVKQLVENFWSKSVGKLLVGEQDTDQIKNQMIEELPELISVMKDEETMSLKDIQERYKCSQNLAEEVIIHLLKIGKISGTFNPFTNILTVNRKSPSEIVQFEEIPDETVEMDQTCFECGAPIRVNAIYCTSCGKEIVNCPVCKLNIDFDDKVGICVHCGTKGHLSHIKEAVKVSGFCPICRTEMDWDTEITEFQRKAAKEV